MSDPSDLPARTLKDEVVFIENLKKLRACFRCHLIKTENQFRKNGCENCPFFHEYNYAYTEYTSPNFEGLICVIDPQNSWVSRHLKISSFIAGAYCLKILDEIKEETREMFAQHNIAFANN